MSKEFEGDAFRPKQAPQAGKPAVLRAAKAVDESFAEMERELGAVLAKDSENFLARGLKADREVSENGERHKLQNKMELSSSYIEACKAKYPSDEKPGEKKAIIVGESPGNIGEALRLRLEAAEGWSVLGFDKENWDPDSISGDCNAIILANASNHMDWVEDFPDRKAREVISDTVMESITSAQSFVKKTIDSPYRKKIIFIGSMAYRNVLNGSSVYCAAKAAVAMYSRCLAWELAPKGYDVFCIHPSNTLDTPMTCATIDGLARYRSITIEAAESYWGAVLPRKSFLTKEEIALVVEQCLSGDMAYLSGGQIELGGGQR